MRLTGLGSGCFSPAQLYQLALDAGFPPGSDQDQGNAGTMAAIAMRESSGCPDATNLSSTEQSYGLWQINVKPAGMLAWLGLTDPNQLKDPQTNAAAAFQMWGGNDGNLDVAWYIHHPGGSYRSRYLANLVAVQAAVGDSGSGVPNLGNDLVPVTGGDTIISSGVVMAAVATIGIALWLETR